MERVRDSLEQLGLSLGEGVLVLDGSTGEPRLDPRRERLPSAARFRAMEILRTPSAESP
jgi:hypothetical protein